MPALGMIAKVLRLLRAPVSRDDGIMLRPMSTEPDRQQQHYVPKFYLKQFANPSTRELQILDFELMTLLAPRGPRGLCSAPYFYAVETGQADETSQEVEKYLGECETAFAHDLPPIIANILNPNQRIDDLEKRVLASFMSMIWVRGQQARDVVTQQQKIALEYESLVVNDLRRRLRPDAELKDVPPKIDNTWHLHLLSKHIGTYARRLHAQHWNVWVSRGAGTFVTSCDPIATVTPKYEGRFPPSFQRCTHYFALTPEISIEAVRRHNMGKRLRRRTLFPDDEDAVDQRNRIIAARTPRYVYAPHRKPLADLLQAFGPPAETRA